MRKTSESFKAQLAHARLARLGGTTQWDHWDGRNRTVAAALTWQPASFPLPRKGRYFGCGRRSLATPDLFQSEFNRGFNWRHTGRPLGTALMCTCGNRQNRKSV